MAIATDGWQDPVLQWEGAHERVVELVEASTAEAMNTVVPATPAWRARDLLAHVVGLDHDVVAGREPDDHGDAWTQSHVDERRHRSVEELLDEWRGDAEAVRQHLRDDPRAMVDVIVHEQDLRGALAAPGARETGGAHLVRKALAGRLGDRVEELDLAPLRLVSPDWTWTSPGSGAPGTVLEASTYDVTRALCSRRTADQLRSWVVEGDVEPYLEAFTLLGPLPNSPLPE